MYFETSNMGLILRCLKGYPYSDLKLVKIDNLGNYE